MSRSIRLGIVVAVFLSVFQGASAADYYWGGGKVDLSGPLPTGTNEPSGVWNATLKNWSTDLSGSSYVAWPNTGADTAWLTNLRLVNLAAVPAITQTVDMTVGRIVAIVSNMTGSCYGSGYLITATNARTLTLVGDSPEFSVSTGPAVTSSENTRRLEIGANVKIASTNGFTKSGYYGGQLLINSDCSAVSGTVRSVDGGPVGSYPSILLNSSAANLRNVSVFDLRCGSLAVQAGAGANDQLNDAAVIRLGGRTVDLTGLASGGFSPSGFDYRSPAVASTETIGQIVLDPFGDIILQSGGAVTHGAVMCGHATAGISRGVDGKGSAQIKANGSVFTSVLYSDLIVSNGVPTGTILPWMSTTEVLPVRFNAATLKLELVPVTLAPDDLTTWVAGSCYVITNGTYTPSGAIPNGTAISTLGVEGPSSRAVVTIGSSPSDTLTLSSGMIAFSSKGGDLVITNGSLTSGTTELDIMTGDSSANGEVFIYSGASGF